MNEDSPFGLSYDAPLTMSDYLGAAQGMVRRIGGAFRFVPKVLTEMREQIKQEAQAPPPTSVARNLPQAVSSLEAQAMENITSGLEKIGVPSALAVVPGMLIGGVLTYPSPAGELRLVNKAGSMVLRRTKVGKQFPEVAESASRYMDEAEAYLKQQGSLEGYPRFKDPTGAEYLPRAKGAKASGEPRLAMSPMSVKQAYTNTRKGRDVTSDSFEKFQRKQFDQMVKENKTDLMVQFAEMPSYVEHNRRLSSPYWKTARAKGQKAGDVDNLTQLFDLDFKNFKDNVDKALDRITDSPIDAFYDPMVDSIVVENIKTGKRLGYLDQGLDIQEQLSRFIDRAL